MSIAAKNRSVALRQECHVHDPAGGFVILQTNIARLTECGDFVVSRSYKHVTPAGVQRDQAVVLLDVFALGVL